MIALARRAGAPISRNGTELEAVVAVSPPDLHCLSMALVQNEAGLLRGLTSTMLGAAWRAAARVVANSMRLLLQYRRGGLTTTSPRPAGGW